MGVALYCNTNGTKYGGRRTEDQPRALTHDSPEWWVYAVLRAHHHVAALLSCLSGYLFMFLQSPHFLRDTASSAKRESRSIILHSLSPWHPVGMWFADDVTIVG